MTEQKYEWPRFWARRASAPASEGGDAATRRSDGSPEDIQPSPLSSFDAHNCLVLLGDMGLGKSTAIREAIGSLRANQDASTEAVLDLDLRSMSTDAWLYKNILDAAPFTRWIQSASDRLYIFLDSFDESIARVDNAAELIVDTISNLKEQRAPLDRLYLRIACRTAVWPAHINRELRSIWDASSFAVLELTELRIEDIARAAVQSNVDAGAFLANISEAGVIALARKPLTLIMLLEEFRRHGNLPSNQRELYIRGCHRLCSETKKTRTAGRSKLTARMRMMIAGRIAAITVFSGRSIILNEFDATETEDSEVALAALRGGRESAGGDSLVIDELAVQEALDTGLFAFGGDGRLMFSHRSFAEFLAAWYLTMRRTDVAQLVSLIVHPTDQKKKLIPQLYGVAAWLAALNSDVFRFVARSNPWLLIQSDVRALTEAQRLRLTARLLRYQERKKTILGWERFSAYRKLAHRNLASVLRPYIRDKGKRLLARLVAIEIAGACKQRQLQDDLLSIILDVSEHNTVRTRAASEFLDLADDVARRQLRPLLLGRRGKDPDDELKGIALHALWPKHLSAKRLFKRLTPPKQPFVIGAYQQFLLREVVPNIRSKDIHIALQWVHDQARKTDDYTIERLADAIVRRAWAYLDNPRAEAAFARLALLRVQSGDGIFGDGRDVEGNTEVVITTEQQRRLVAMMVEHVKSVEDLWRPALTKPSLPTGEDLSWLLDQFRNADSDDRRLIWAELIDRTIQSALLHDSNYIDADKLNQIVLAGDDNGGSILKSVLIWMFEIIEIGSPRAAQMKSAYEEQTRRLRGREPKLLDPPPSVRIDNSLRRCETEDPKFWWVVAYNLTLAPDGTRHADLQVDLLRLPGWISADDSTRNRIVESAKIYLDAADPATERWLGQDTIFLDALAGYKALRLLRSCYPKHLAQLSADVWRRWAPVLVACQSLADEHEARRELLFMAYNHAQHEIINTLIAVIKTEGIRDGHIGILYDLEPCWDRALGEALIRTLQESIFGPRCTEKILEALLRHKVTEAKLYAEQLLARPLSDDDVERKRIIAAARALYLYAPDTSFRLVWNAIESDADLGRDITTTVAQEQVHLVEAAFAALSSQQLADWCLWIDQHFAPFSTFKRARRLIGQVLRGPSADDTVADFADTIISQLKERGAVDELKRIAAGCPQRDVSYPLLDAGERARLLTWERPSPQDLLKLLRNREKRLVRNGDELLLAIEESIDRLQVDLQAETPASIFLWDGKRPKDEAAVSDYVKLHLQRDLKHRGLVVSREVEIRGARSGEGERSDIYVAASRRGSRDGDRDKLVAIVEVKGCWNRELDVAMETQLSDRYLLNNAYRNGLYLVAWFHCSQWKRTDSRRRRKHVHAATLTETAAKLTEQAAHCGRIKGLRLRAKVLDISLRQPSPRRRTNP